MPDQQESVTRWTQEPVGVSVLVPALLVTLLYFLEAYGILLGAVYGILAADYYNRSDFGKRIRRFLRGSESVE